MNEIREILFISKTGEGRERIVDKFREENQFNKCIIKVKKERTLPHVVLFKVSDVLKKI